jgi:hypothetical protein
MSDELIEKVAREIVANLKDDYINTDWRNWKDEARAAIAVVRAAVIEECARAMNPMLRSMISRAEAARIIRAIAKTGETDNG